MQCIHYDHRLLPATEVYAFTATIVKKQIQKYLSIVYKQLYSLRGLITEKLCVCVPKWQNNYESIIEHQKIKGRGPTRSARISLFLSYLVPKTTSSGGNDITSSGGNDITSSGGNDITSSGGNDITSMVVMTSLAWW